MACNYAFLNKAYFSLLLAGLLVFAVSSAAFFAMRILFFPFLALAFVLVLAGIICKILVWYNVYSEVVTKEDFKRVTASGNIFRKHLKRKN